MQEAASAELSSKRFPGGDRARARCHSHYLKFYKIEKELESTSERVLVFISSSLDLSRLYHFEALNIDTPAGVFNPVVKSTVYKLYYFQCEVNSKSWSYLLCKL